MDELNGGSDSKVNSFLECEVVKGWEKGTQWFKAPARDG